MFEEFYYTVSSSDIRPYMPDVPVLFPASSFVRENPDGSYRLKPPTIPEHVTLRAADCGGFVATFKWGDYRYSPDQYVDWLNSGWKPTWAAMMDYCCEDEITSGKQGVVRERQDKTTGMAYRFWDDYRDVDWVWVPTIQGWTVADYRRHARAMKPLILEMQQHYGARSAFRVGIGTLCRRASEQMIRDVVMAVVDVLGPDIPIHLWGVKLSYIQSKVAMPAQIMSADSAAWNALFYRDRTKYHESGLTQRMYTWTVAGVEYGKKIDAALSSPKQNMMFLSPNEEPAS